MNVPGVARLDHDIRGALGLIVGHADLLRETANLGERQLRHVDIITKAANQILTMLEASAVKD